MDLEHDGRNHILKFKLRAHCFDRQPAQASKPVIFYRNRTAIFVRTRTAGCSSPPSTSAILTIAKQQEVIIFLRAEPIYYAIYAFALKANKARLKVTPRKVLSCILASTLRNNNITKEKQLIVNTPTSLLSSRKTRSFSIF